MSLSQFRIQLSRLLIFTSALLLLMIFPVHLWADDGVVDWRANLTCKPEQQTREGMMYCTGEDRNDHPVHVHIVDLSSSHVHFEYVLPKGLHKVKPGTPAPEPTPQECRDPNVPGYGGPEGGCYSAGSVGQYPTMEMPVAVERAKEIAPDKPLAMVINADYGKGGHGPEGLVVVRGERLDGAQRCDDDYNAMLRPWLGLGNHINSFMGTIPASIDRLENDGSPVPDWLYTGIGGGPWLVKDGKPYAGVMNCSGDKTASVTTPVEQCFDYQKPTPSMVTEDYAGGSCRAAPHTAAGLSGDGRFLFLVVTTGNDKPDVIRDFMKHQLGVWDALKFDGGGSTQFWHDDLDAGNVKGSDDLPGWFDIGHDKRTLSNYLAVYAYTGDGIKQLLDATPTESVLYKVVNAGETVDLWVEMKNTGDFTWLPEDHVGWRKIGGGFGDLLESTDENTTWITKPIPPGISQSKRYQFEANGMNIHRFGMVKGDEFFGTSVTIVVVGLPPGLQEQRAVIERMIEETIAEWKATGEESVKGLWDELQEQFKEFAREAVEDVKKGVIKKLKEWLDGTCGGSTAMLIVAGIFVLYRRRKS